jgi:hypothetical protein
MIYSADNTTWPKRDRHGLIDFVSASCSNQPMLYLYRYVFRITVKMVSILLYLSLVQLCRDGRDQAGVRRSRLSVDISLQSVIQL